MQQIYIIIRLFVVFVVLMIYCSWGSCMYNNWRFYRDRRIFVFIFIFLQAIKNYWHLLSKIIFRGHCPPVPPLSYVLVFLTVSGVDQGVLGFQISIFLYSKGVFGVLSLLLFSMYVGGWMGQWVVVWLQKCYDDVWLFS